MKVKILRYKVNKILNIHKYVDSWFWNKYSAYPYKGCQFGCEFCYNREARFRPYKDPEDFSKVITIKQNAAELLRDELSKVPVDLIAIGDYQPVERKNKISRKMLGVCLDLKFPVFILERSPLVLRDLDILEDINKNTTAIIAFSIITTPKSKNYSKLRFFEPKSPKVNKRFEVMRKISKKGILTGTVFMPILPYIFDDDENIEDVIKMTVANGGSFVVGGGLTLGRGYKKRYFDILERINPLLVKKYKALYPTYNVYGPDPEYLGKIALKVTEICEKYQINDRIPRPIEFFPEKIKLNKKIAEIFFDKVYRMEIENKSVYRVWAYRKASWALDALEENVYNIYKESGLIGLDEIRDIGEFFSRQIEEEIKKLIRI